MAYAFRTDKDDPKHKSLGPAGVLRANAGNEVLIEDAAAAGMNVRW